MTFFTRFCTFYTFFYIIMHDHNMSLELKNTNDKLNIIQNQNKKILEKLKNTNDELNIIQN